MKILLANPRGFCAGVNMAIECLEEAIRQFGTDIYVYHEIVHNKHVVERFTRQGITFVDDIAEIPAGSILLYSAHGVAPELRERARARHLQTIDATCPLVTKVHIEALKFARDGFNIILIGHEGHDEVIGTMGEAPESITLVETPDEVDKLEIPVDAPISYLTQTTLSVNEAAEVIQRLKTRYPDIVAPPKEDICYATTNRQEAIQTLAPQADVVIVLGSQNSSNSLRLMEIGKSCHKQAILIDGIDQDCIAGNDVESLKLTGSETILITAGASAPENVVQQCVDYFVEEFGATVEEVTIREEHVNFPLPKELRVLSNEVSSEK